MTPSQVRLLDPPPIEVVSQRLAELQARIEMARRDQRAVKVLAVTKGFSADAVAAALATGIRDVGENYADELIAKVSSLDGAARTEKLRWHYLGAIQRRRVKDLAAVVDMWHTVSRVEEGEVIEKWDPGATVMVQVEATGLPQRNGCRPSEVPALVGSLRELGVDVRGLMTVGPQGSPEGSRKAFRTTARLAEELDLPELSMGMTDDLDIAVEEGATIVRVGRALFGERDDLSKHI